MKKLFSCFAVLLCVCMLVSATCFAGFNPDEYVRGFKFAKGLKTVEYQGTTYEDVELIWHPHNAMHLEVSTVWSEYLSRAIEGQTRYSINDWLNKGRFELLAAKLEGFVGGIVRYDEPVFYDKVLWYEHKDAENLINTAMKLGRSGEYTGGWTFPK